MPSACLPGMTQTTATDSAASPSHVDSTCAVRLRHVTHHYPQAARSSRRGNDNNNTQKTNARPALRDVSFDIPAGQIFGILGPNGGGKTTLFRLLTTMLRPSQAEASIELFGINVLQQPAQVRQLLGVVFQSPSVDGQLSVEENLRLQGKLYGLAGTALNERIDACLTQFNLMDRRGERVARLSGGLRRRVELAKALLHKPRLLLLDEPSTGLDVAARRDLWQHLQQLRDQQGTTIVLTTHDMLEAQQCDRLAIIHQGSYVTDDTVANLRTIIRGQVITLEPMEENNHAAQSLVQRIASQFGPWTDGAAPVVVDGRVRFEHDDGPAMVARIASTWPHQIRSFNVSQPTLEDVFLHLTGEQLHDE